MTANWNTVDQFEDKSELLQLVVARCLWNVIRGGCRGRDTGVANPPAHIDESPRRFP